MAKPGGHTAVMAGRREPPSSLDFFPTPPWATRALCHYVLRAADYHERTAWDPAAGEGHMAETLRRWFPRVLASDVHDYGCGYEVGSFVGVGSDVIRKPFAADWIITNPPFNLALEFVEEAVAQATVGVAMLVRVQWLHTVQRYERLFRDMPPAEVALFVERVAMVKGRWDPEASTATDYCWVIWRRGVQGAATRLTWIPPGCKERLTEPTDVQRFCAALNSEGNAHAV